ncbi:MAG TPA: hypothetical protein VEY95_01975 [Azospirillaceae bacterium]|nr:hypothetical protein [Azospirillaceae bacterium]
MALRNRLALLAAAGALGFCGLPAGVAMAQDAHPLSGRAYEHAAQAYAALNRQDLVAAEREARAAVERAPENPNAVRLLVDVLARAGNGPAAMEIADQAIARGVQDSGLHAQRGYLRAAAGRPEAAMEDFRTALATPGLAAERVRELRLSLADQALAAGRPAEVLDALDPYAGDTGYAVNARRGFALFALERYADAAAAFEAASAAAATPEDRRTADKGWAQSAAALGDQDRVRGLVRTLADGTAGCDPDLIYLLMRANDDAGAIAMADAPGCAGSLTPGVQADLGYATKRLHRNREAAGRFTAALDGYRGAGSAVLDPMAEFGLRREVDTLVREFGLTGGYAWRTGRSDAGGGTAAQLILEGYWQPEWFGFQDGRVFQAYARLSNDAPGAGSPAPGTDSLLGAVGVRYKPLADLNLVLAAERHIAFGDAATSDWLVRAGYSGGFGLDLNPVEQTWTFEQHYAEAGYYLQQERALFSAEARYGLTTKLFGSQTLTGSAYLGAGLSYDQAEPMPFAAGIGPGLSLRYWFRETAHRAPASYVQVDFGYRVPVTASDRAGGIVLQVHVSF